MSSEYTVKLMPQAERDLDDIFNYITIELQNSKAAADLIDKIISTLEDLNTMPNKYPKSIIPELARDGYRKCIIKNYVALYKIHEKTKTVIVARIFYGMRDYKNLDLF